MKGVVEAEERKKGSRREERENKERQCKTYLKGTSRKRGRITKNGRTERLDRRSNSEGQRKEREIERKRERQRKSEKESDRKRYKERERETKSDRENKGMQFYLDE